MDILPKGEIVRDAKQAILTLISRIEDGQIPPEKAWDQIKLIKEEYVEERGQQSWNSFIGHRFQTESAVFEDHPFAVHFTIY